MPQPLTTSQINHFILSVNTGGVEQVKTIYADLFNQGYNYAGWAGGVAELNFNDVINGDAGKDKINGLDGKDIINGDGLIKAGFMNSVAAASHGNDFLDGDASDDDLTGGGVNDVVYGGADNNMMWDDASGKRSTTNLIASCARSTGVSSTFGSRNFGSISAAR